MVSNRPGQIPLPGRSSPPPADAQEPTTPRPTVGSANSGGYPFAAPGPSLLEKRRMSQSEPVAVAPIKIDIPQPPRLLAREFASSIANSNSTTPQPNSMPRGNLASDGGLLPATMTTALNVAAASSNSSGRMARSSTITKNTSGGSNSSASKRSGSRQPPIRKDTDAGYEGGVERHGQANDFVDEPEDEDSHDESIPPSANTSAKHTRSDSSPPASANSKNSSASNNLGGQKFPDLSDSYHRNRNPSASAHHHPSKLPLHSRRSQNPRQLYKTKGRTASMSSTRSTEAQNHPFPTPGMNNDPAGKDDGLFDDWKSVEETRLDEDERKEKHWKRWGPYVSERQWVSPSFLEITSIVADRSATGDCSGRLLGERRCLDSLPTRARSIASVSMGRGRTGWNLRQSRKDVFRCWTVEWRRSDSQGANVWCYWSSRSVSSYRMTALALTSISLQEITEKMSRSFTTTSTLRRRIRT